MVKVINTRKDRLYVDDYLTIHGYPAEASLFVCTEDVPDFRKYVESFLSMLDGVFENNSNRFFPARNGSPRLLIGRVTSSVAAYLQSGTQRGSVACSHFASRRSPSGAR